MFLAEVIGQVVATKKDEQMVGRKLLLLRPKLVDEKDPTRFKDGSNTIVAVDTVGAGEGELVMFCQGSSARAAQGLKSIPVDAAIVAIIDRVEVHGKHLYKLRFHRKISVDGLERMGHRKGQPISILFLCVICEICGQRLRIPLADPARTMERWL